MSPTVRNLVIAAIVFGVAFALVRGKMRKSAEEKWEREVQQQRESEDAARQRALDRDRQIGEQFISAQNCATAMRNRKVLDDAHASGGSVITMRDGKPLSEAQARAAYGENESYIAQNCRNK